MYFREQINNLVNDKSKLEEQHGFKLQVIGDNDGVYRIKHV